MVDPSDAELEVLKLFWRRGPSSVREVQDDYGVSAGWAASTTRTVLERMAAKGLLKRRSVHGLAVYAPAQDKVAVIGRALKKFAQVLEIDGPLPASAFTGSQILNEDEIAELEAMLKEEGQ
jgi:predicted transcriptional regulator